MPSISIPGTNALGAVLSFITNTPSTSMWFSLKDTLFTSLSPSICTGLSCITSIESSRLSLDSSLYPITATFLFL